MRDLSTQELGFVYGAGMSPCPPTKARKHKKGKNSSMKYGKGSGSRGGKGSGSRKHHGKGSCS